MHASENPSLGDNSDAVLRVYVYNCEQCSSAQIHIGNLYIYGNGNGSGDGDNVLSDCRYGVTIVQLYCPAIVFRIHLHELCVSMDFPKLFCAITEFKRTTVRIKFQVYDGDTIRVQSGKGESKQKCMCFRIFYRFCLQIQMFIDRR